MSQKKYKKGKQIQSLPEFIDRLEQRKPFYRRDKFMAAGFLEHWSIVMIKNAIKYGNLYYADSITNHNKEETQ